MIGPGALHRAVHLVVEDPRLPHLLARRRVEREDIAVGAGIDNVVPVDREVPVGRVEAAGGGVLRQVAPVLPQEIAGGGVERLDDVPRIRQVHHPVVDQRGRLLAARTHAARPDHAQRADVLPVHLVQRAVAPAVQGAAPHQPVGWSRILEHRVGDRHEVAGRLRAEHSDDAGVSASIPGTMSAAARAVRSSAAARQGCGAAWSTRRRARCDIRNLLAPATRADRGRGPRHGTTTVSASEQGDAPAVRGCDSAFRAPARKVSSRNASRALREPPTRRRGTLRR